MSYKNSDFLIISEAWQRKPKGSRTFCMPRHVGKKVGKYLVN